MPLETRWVELGTGVMREARVRLGLSYESLARAVPVSAKTWARWETRGEVPRAHLQRVADVLGLAVEYVDDGHAETTIRLDAAGVDLSERLAAVEARLARVEARARRIEALAQSVQVELQGAQGAP